MYLPLELILDPVSPSPHYFCTCLYYYENSRKPIALEANTLLVFALNTVFFLSSAHIFILSVYGVKRSLPVQLPQAVIASGMTSVRLWGIIFLYGNI